MKKYILLIISIIIFALKFLDNWFRYEILDLYFVPFLLYDFIIIICYLVVLTLIIIKICNKKNLKENIIALCFLIAIISFLFIPTQKIRTMIEFEPLMEKRMLVIEKIKNGELVPNEFGYSIYLDKEYKNVSPCNRVRIYKNDEEGVVVGFLLKEGGLIDKDIELIYTTGGRELMFESKNYPLSGDTIIELKEEWFYVIQY